MAANNANPNPADAFAHAEFVDIDDDDDGFSSTAGPEELHEAAHNLGATEQVGLILKNLTAAAIANADAAAAVSLRHYNLLAAEHELSDT